VDYPAWLNSENRIERYPLLTPEEYLSSAEKHSEVNFLSISIEDLTDTIIQSLKADLSVVLIAQTDNEHAMAELRKCFFRLMNNGVKNPVIIKRSYPDMPAEQTQLYASTDVGGLLIDGLGDGIFL